MIPVCLCLSACTIAAAQVVAPDEPTINTDRPGFFEGTGTVPALRVQLESGLTFTRDGEDDSFVVPQATLRLGLTAWGEAFVDLPSWNWEDPDGAGTDEGWGDTTIGFKARFWDQAGARPAVALVGEMALPTGDGAFSGGDVSPRALVAASWGLGESLTLVANGALAFPVDGDERYVEGSQALALSAALTDRLGAFVEYYGYWRASGGGGPEHYADGGFTYLLTRRVQVDVNGGVGLNGRASDWFVGAGLSVLF